MFLAVKLYKNVTPRVSGIPDYWPAEVRELGDSRTLPGSEWMLMTKEAFAKYRAERLPEYLKWQAAQPQEPSVPAPEEE